MAAHQPAIAVTHNDAVAIVTIQRGSKRNALTLDMWQAIPQLIASAAAADGTRVVVLRGEPGGDFSAGADISEFSEKRREPAEVEAYSAAVQHASDSLAMAEVPTIAAIEGYCIGGGCLLAASCDLRVASETAVLGITPGKLGIVYSFEATRQLVELVGPGWARYLLLTGSQLAAGRCAQIGLIHDVYPVSEFEYALRTLAARVASLAPLSVRGARDYIRLAASGVTEAGAATQHYQQPSADYAERISGFLGRRRPDSGT